VRVKTRGRRYVRKVRGRGFRRVNPGGRGFLGQLMSGLKLFPAAAPDAAMEIAGMSLSVLGPGLVQRYVPVALPTHGPLGLVTSAVTSTALSILVGKFVSPRLGGNLLSGAIKGVVLKALLDYAPGMVTQYVALPGRSVAALPAKAGGGTKGMGSFMTADQVAAGESVFGMRDYMSLRGGMGEYLALPNGSAELSPGGESF
jgi:hypothetical protein